MVLHVFRPCRLRSSVHCLCVNVACLRAPHRTSICVDWVLLDSLFSNMCVAQAYYSRRLLRCGWQAVRCECPSLLFLLPSRPAAVCHLVAADDSQPLVCHRVYKTDVHLLPHTRRWITCSVCQLRVIFRFAYSLSVHKNCKDKGKKKHLSIKKEGKKKLFNTAKTPYTKKYVKIHQEEQNAKCMWKKKRNEKAVCGLIQTRITWAIWIQ